MMNLSAAKPAFILVRALISGAILYSVQYVDESTEQFDEVL